MSEEEVTSAFQRSVDDGRQRLGRTWPNLLATGAVGAVDVSVGVLALMIVKDATGNKLLGALAFTIGFLFLALAHGELFDEDFFVPVVAVTTGDASPLALLRLWGGTLVANLAAGWLAIGIVMTAFPQLRKVALDVGAFAPGLGIGAKSFAGAALGGSVLTLLTWMERSSDSVGAKIVSSMAVGFVLAAGPLNHSVIGSLEMFAALHVGAPFGYGDFAGAFAWAAFGNIVGGTCLVTVLRLVQVGSDVIEVERARDADAPQEELLADRRGEQAAARRQDSSD